MSNTCVTVVIPCHNHAKWVNDAIDSVAGQDHPTKRIVVVDDGSTDGSSDAVLRRLESVTAGPPQEPAVFLGKANGVQVMLATFKDARGPSFARNYGVRAGWDGTDAFMFLDSDDMYHAGKVSKSVAKWGEAPHQIGVVYTDYDTYSPYTGLKVRHYKEPFDRIRLLKECLPNMDSLISRLAFERCGLFDEELRTCEDYDMWIRVSEQFMLVHIPETLLTLRVGEHSSTSTVSQHTWTKNRMRVMAKTQARMQNDS